MIRLSRGFAVSGRVVDAATGGPIADAQVDFQLSGSPEDRPAVQKTGKSAADGTFTVKGLPPGRIRVLVLTGDGRPRDCGIHAAPASGISITVPDK